MTDIQLRQLTEAEAGTLAAARTRIGPASVKQALGRVRLEFRKKADTYRHSESSNPPQEESGFVSFPDLPPHTRFNGELLADDITMTEAFTDGQMACEGYPFEDDDASYQEDLKDFEARQEWYNSIKNPTMQHKVELAAAKRKLDIRTTRFERRKDIRQRELAEQAEQRRLEEIQTARDNLFVPQDPVLQLLEQPPVQAVAQPIAPPRAYIPGVRFNPHRVSAAEKRRSMEIGFEPILERLQGKDKRKRAGNQVSEPGISEAVEAGGKRKRRKKNENNNSNVLSSLTNNVLKEAHDSSLLPGPAEFNASNRRDAMEQLLASIPATDWDEAKDDKTKINNALKSFTNTVRCDKLEGVWKIKGLRTGLYNYQVLGCAFMRERENSPEEPRGGILADVMGIGKTFEALANIMDGLPHRPEDPPQTTLLVVPSHLTKHWMDQMKKHCDIQAIGGVVNYHAMAKLHTLDDIEDLQRYSIVVTTYEEVRKSYPTFKPPKELTNEKKLREDWTQIYEECRGPLHRIKFHRIVLDEAHIIRNWKSNVSIAVRGLIGQHKWLLSGTPILNYNEEFYPLLSFLDVSGLGKHNDFISYYRNDEQGNERLANLLRAYMMRRTHASRLFALPIIQLPDIKETTMNVMFSEAEWIIYQAIEEMFFESINDLRTEPNFKAAQCRCCLTMILRLRMFCSHPLTVQHILKFLLRSGPLMKKLEDVSRKTGDDTSNSSSEIVSGLIEAKFNFQKLVQKRKEEELDQTRDDDISNNNPQLVGRFRELMERIRQEENAIEEYDRTACPNCNFFSDKVVVTSCLHLYCDECFNELLTAVDEAEPVDMSSASLEKSKPMCLRCESPIEEATRCGFSKVSAPTNQTTPEDMKRKRHELTRTRRKKKGTSDADDEEDENDWIRAWGAKMPGAKLDKIKDIIRKWRRVSRSTKVVIFSQFTDFIRILAAMCQEEGWGYRCLYGKMSIPSRHKSLDDFGTNPEVTILLVSLHTGGTGLDMTVAHKCILVDLWWNEAVQFQAFCRLLRHGQTKDVECVKLVVKDTIDDYMLELQTKKTEDIKSTMGDEILMKRDSVVALVKLFADVSQDESGRLYVKPKQGRNREGKIREALSLGKSRGRKQVKS